jgi:hypothetical protein
MGQYKQKFHIIRALVNLGFVLFMLCLTYKTVLAANPTTLGSSDQDYFSNNSSVEIGTSPVFKENRIGIGNDDPFHADILRVELSEVKPWWRQIAVIILVAGILVSVSVVGAAVWRIKE